MKRDKMGNKIWLGFLFCLGALLSTGCESHPPWHHRGANPERDPYRRVNPPTGSERHDRIEHAHFRCPRHPEIVQTEPGYCRVCGSRLRQYDR